MSKRNLLSLLRDTYAAYQREGWEATQTLAEVMEEVGEVLEGEGIKPVKEIIEEVQ